MYDTFIDCSYINVRGLISNIFENYINLVFVKCMNSCKNKFQYILISILLEEFGYQDYEKYVFYYWSIKFC